MRRAGFLVVYWSHGRRRVDVLRSVETLISRHKSAGGVGWGLGWLGGLGGRSQGLGGWREGG